MGLRSAGLGKRVHLWWPQCLQPQTLSSSLFQRQSFLRLPEYKGTPFNQPKLTSPALPASGSTHGLGKNRLKIRHFCQFSRAVSSVIKTPMLCVVPTALASAHWSCLRGSGAWAGMGVSLGCPRLCAQILCMREVRLLQEGRVRGGREVGSDGFYFLMRPKCLLFSPSKYINKMFTETIAYF